MNYMFCSFFTGSDKCGENEVYTTCGTSCPETCSFKPQICNYLCNEGCFCKDGFVRDSNGACISRELCEKCPKANQIYKDCGSACPLTCKNMNDQSLIMCIQVCRSGCFCIDGFVLNEKGECVNPKQCPK